MKPWDEVFLEVCSAVAKRSKDPDTQIGACVVDIRNVILGTGFNGPPRTAPDACVPMERPGKYPWMIHAELNAVLFALSARGSYMLEECTLYTSGLPCAQCVLIAAHVGIKRVVHGEIMAACADEANQGLMRAIAAMCGVSVMPRNAPRIDPNASGACSTGVLPPRIPARPTVNPGN